jgi:hypothetical protein
MKRVLRTLVLGVGLVALATADSTYICNCNPQTQSCVQYTIDQSWWQTWGALMMAGGITVMGYFMNVIQTVP